MATSFNTQTGGGEYHLQFETTDRDKFLFMQEAARRCVDGPEKTAAGREALIERLRSTASVSKRKMLDAAADALENSIVEADALRKEIYRLRDLLSNANAKESEE